MHQRSLMLEKFLQMNLSSSTEGTIMDTFENLPRETEILEAHAEKINLLMDSCKTEAEVLQKIADWQIKDNISES